MPRDIPVSNGTLLVTFDKDYQIRDIYFPHVGMENHAGWGPCRFGVFVDGQHSWTSDPKWQKSIRYLRETLVTSVTLVHPTLKLKLYCNDAIDFHRDVLIRRIKVTNLASTDREVRVFQQQDFSMYGTKVGDTAYYDPRLKAMLHYRGSRYLLASFQRDGKHGPDSFAAGACGFQGAEGTWRDAEDGMLSGNPIAQGAVDSTIGCHLHIPAGESVTVYYYLVAAKNLEEIDELTDIVRTRSPEWMIQRTIGYWRAWIAGPSFNFGNMPTRVIELYKRSLLVVRSQTDDSGAVIAANDSDVMQFNRDTYSYMWPRDGALACLALDMAGYPDLAHRFFRFCAKVLSPGGYLLHKFNPDGTPASSWHPWLMDGKEQLPIQEDQTALVIWSLWEHYWFHRDVEFVRPLFYPLILKAADFMVDWRDPETHLPLPCYDLWEERHGIHAWTVSAVYGALVAARNFAELFSDTERAEKYKNASEEIKEAIAKHLYSEDLGRFVRRLVSTDDGFEVDEVVDASLVGIFKFGVFEPNDPRVVSTMRAVEDKLWVKTQVGGVARYEDDNYHRISADTRSVPGNPWFVCTAWLADYLVARATNTRELRQALPILQWITSHALPSGVLAEQVNPYTNDPISVSPLTWSHATFITTVLKYVKKLEELHTCPTCGRSLFRRLDRRDREQARSVKGEDVRSIFFPHQSNKSDLVSSATVSNNGRQVTVSIDAHNCVGCGICILRCQSSVLQMHNDKAMISLERLPHCTLCRLCEEACAVNTIRIEEPHEPDEQHT
ncbi:MAG: glycoside hydrolase family 15 protein [Planctomycetia bacterium]|nr:glycoside hydrolase family 15 protein [Planctomycetia bacterium]